MGKKSKAKASRPVENLNQPAGEEANVKAAKKSLKWGFLVAVALLAGVATVFALNFPGMSGVEKVKVVNGVVAIPLAKVSDGSAHFYRYTDGGKEIKFFVVKGSDGQIHTALIPAMSASGRRRGMCRTATPCSARTAARSSRPTGSDPIPSEAAIPPTSPPPVTAGTSL